MRKIDSFFDTYEKRTCFIELIYLSCALIYILMHLLLGSVLIHIQNYEQVLSLVDKWIVQQSFFGRNALQLLTIQVFDPFEFLVEMINSITLFESIYLIGTILLLFTKQKKLGWFHLLFLVLSGIILVVIFLLGISSTTLFMIIGYIRMIGISFCTLNLIALAYTLYMFKRMLHAYGQALRVEVIICE